ncbi:MAG: ABC transporter ATP-binding protein [Treponema sp.]|jgi:iron complex transport system ATP-binding protein|nr:ABC transporter ATP-binding protein [Treponema sp.]
MGLEIDDLSFSWRRQPTLVKISLSLKAGVFTGCLGPNGSGKSTFLKNILGFLKPSGGRVLYSGTADEAPRPFSTGERSRRFAFVPQFAGARASFTVWELALTGRLPHMKSRWQGYTKSDYRKTAEILEMLGIDSISNRNILTLSGGELQKTLIARCLVQEGDVLLLDEATSGLDLNHAVEIMELMRKKADQEGKIVLAVLHDLNLAAQYCDRILLLKNGRLRYQGSPAEILTENIVEEIYGIRVAVSADDKAHPVILPRRAAKTTGGV